MKVSKELSKNIIGGMKQYVVPLFQRHYSWGEKEWEILWEDLSDLLDDNNNKEHFFGSIVLIPLESDANARYIDRYQLIDGQQRITTIFILLILLRNFAKEDGNLFKTIENMLSNSPVEENDEYFKHTNNHLKLLPTQVDRAAFKRLVEIKDLEDGSCKDSCVDRCYAFFKAEIIERTITDDNLAKLYYAIVGRLCMATITLDPDDNPYLIFESLNAKGQPLSQADLIRNYVFMQIPEDSQDTIHARDWEPMQTMLGDNLTRFIRDYLIMHSNRLVKDNCVYSEIKPQINKDIVLCLLQDLHKFASYYRKLLMPDQEHDSRVREDLTLLKELKQTTCYPFLLRCYHEHAQHNISSEQLIDILHITINFIVRRHICAIPTHNLNKIFPILYKKSERYADRSQGLCYVLQWEHYPRDDVLGAKLLELLSAQNASKSQKVKLVKKIIEGKLTKAKRKLPKNIMEYVEAASEIWPYFGNKPGDENIITDVSRTKPSTIRFFGEETKVSHWREVLTITLSTIAELQPEILPVLAKRYPGYVSKAEFSSSHKLINGFYVNVGLLSASDIHKFCTRVVEIMNEEGNMNEMWEVDLADSAGIVRYPM